MKNRGKLFNRKRKKNEKLKEKKKERKATGARVNQTPKSAGK
jgi:hypothetical protein